MRGQRDARLNLDFHAMTEAPESQMHVVDRVRCVLRHATNHNAVAQKKRAPTGDNPAEAPGQWACQGGHPPGSMAIVRDRQATVTWAMRQTRPILSTSPPGQRPPNLELALEHHVAKSRALATKLRRLHWRKEMRRL